VSLVFFIFLELPFFDPDKPLNSLTLSLFFMVLFAALSASSKIAQPITKSSRHAFDWPD
jgi:hypothetical protein